MTRLPSDRMAKEKLIPWTIRNCNEKNFVGMGWVDPKKGTFFLDWTRQGNTGWIPSDAAREWSKMKGHLKKKKPRDLKAGLRNAYRSKKEELVRVHIPKEIAERDGRKRMIWRFLDLESELKKISNPPTKAKKSATTKIRRNTEKMVLEDDTPSCSSTVSDFEYIFPKYEETQDKGKFFKKKGIRTKVSPKKQSMYSAKPLPPIRSLIRNCSFVEDMCDTSKTPLQSQDISSTFSETRFPENVTEYVSFIPKNLSSYPGGLTPPPQKTDVMYHDPDKMSQSRSNIKSDNYFNYYECQDSLFLNQSDESIQSLHSNSSLWNSPIYNQFQTSQVLSQSDESHQSPHSCSPLLDSSNPNNIQNTQVFYQSDGNMNTPHSDSLSGYQGSSYNQFHFPQGMNQPGESCDATSSNVQTLFSPNPDQLLDSASQSQKASEEQMCDILQRVTPPSLYSNVTFPDLIVQYSPSGAENQSLFPDFTLLEIPLMEFSQSKEEVLVEWGLEASIDYEENFLDLSQLILKD